MSEIVVGLELNRKGLVIRCFLERDRTFRNLKKKLSLLLNRGHVGNDNLCRVDLID